MSIVNKLCSIGKPRSPPVAVRSVRGADGRHDRACCRVVGAARACRTRRGARVRLTRPGAEHGRDAPRLHADLTEPALPERNDGAPGPPRPTGRRGPIGEPDRVRLAEPSPAAASLARSTSVANHGERPELSAERGRAEARRAPCKVVRAGLVAPAAIVLQPGLETTK
jgi:hypothetical protein